MQIDVVGPAPDLVWLHVVELDLLAGAGCAVVEPISVSQVPAGGGRIERALDTGSTGLKCRRKGHLTRQKGKERYGHWRAANRSESGA